ncbi:MAG: CMD domain-containing protein [Lautropia sp.]
MSAPPSDLVDRLCGLVPGDRTHATRHRRDKVVAATHASHDALFDPGLDGLALGERLLVALLASRLSASSLLTAHYLAEARAAGCAAADVDAVMAATPVADPRLREILSFARTLVERPVAADKAALLRLPQAGLATPAVVALAQLVAYLSYQIRLVAGLCAMKDAEASMPTTTNALATDATPDAGEAQRRAQLQSQASTGSPQALPPGDEPIRIAGFTSESLEWSAWLDVVDPAAASPEQLAVLAESHPKAMVSDYYRLLVHQPRILRERSAAFNAIMYAPGGLPRAERELASTVVSRINGCVYCASVHAQRFAQLARRDDAIRQVFADPRTAGTTERERAIVAFSIAMTEAPHRVGAADIDALSKAGLDDAGVLDLLHSVAIFAWANRLMLNLGEPVYGR